MIWMFFYNLRTPVSLACLLGLALCLWFGVMSRNSRELDSAGKTTILLSGIILAVIGSVIWAVPAPDYNVIYRDRVVYQDKRIEVPVFKGVREVPSTYQSVFDKCVASTAYRADSDLIKLCHQQAREASTTPPTVKVVYKPSPYKELFDSCNDGWTGSIQDMKDPEVTFKARQERMGFCQTYATQGATIH